MAISLTAHRYVHGVYIPTALLLVGIYIVKKEWIPYAIVVAISLGSWKIYSDRMFTVSVEKE